MRNETPLVLFLSQHISDSTFSWDNENEKIQLFIFSVYLYPL